MKIRRRPSTKIVDTKRGKTRVAVRRERRRDANRAIAFLRNQKGRKSTRCPHGWTWKGHCAHTVACAYGTRSGANVSPGGGAYSGWDAWEGWVKTAERYRRDGRNVDNPPRGALVFFRGGQYGHVAISNGRRRVWGNDAPVSGLIGLVPLGWFTTYWGFQYVGWVWPDEVSGW